MADNKKSSISKRSSCYLLNLKQPEKTARRLKLSFKRTSATVSILKADRSVEASVGFLDVSETGAGIFTPELLHKGSMVVLCITEPSVLKVRGIVAWSIPVTTGIHAGKFKCRSGIQFVFDGDAQQVSVQEFVRKAGMDPIETIKNATPPPPVSMPPGNNTDATLAAPATPAAGAPAPAAEGAAPVSAAPPATPVADASAAPAAPAAETSSAPPSEPATPTAPVAEAPVAPAPEAAPATPTAAAASEAQTPDTEQKAA